MTASFRDLKKSRDAMFDMLNKQVEQDNAKGGGRPEADKRFWYPEVDQAGNGFAIIRFLPPAEGETIPYVREFAHGFKGPNGWYINKSRTTLRTADGKFESDPVSEYNREEWKRAEGLELEGRKEAAEAIKKQVKNRKRNVSYISNILVLKDSANPENEGKVFLFRYGTKINDKIQAKMKPEFEGDIAVNIFDFWDGANFRLKITTNRPLPGQKKGFRNYDNSEFDSVAPLLGGDDSKLEALWKTLNKLQPLVAPESFKSYEELETEFNRAMRVNKKAADPVAAEPEFDAAGATFDSAAQRFSGKAVETPPWDEDGAGGTADADDDLAYYRNLAQQAE